MDRRSLLKRLLAIPAALLGLKAAEEAEVFEVAPPETEYLGWMVRENDGLPPYSIPQFHGEISSVKTFTPCTNNPPHRNHTLLCGKWADA